MARHFRRSGGISKQGASLKSSGLRALSKWYSLDKHAASGMVLRLSTRETMSLITSVGSEFQPLFRRTLLGSAIVSAWVSEEGGGALAGWKIGRLCADKDGEENMCSGKWTGDDDYSTPLDLRDTYQQRRVMSMPDNLLE